MSVSRAEATRTWRRRSPISGADHIAEAFEAARADGRRAALMPYLMGGFPDLKTSLRIGQACVEHGADVLELGVPFSDPLADGPVIHAAGTAALEAGATVEGVLEVARGLAAGVPVVVMCYANQILTRGLERFLDMLSNASVSGLIVPDLPLEESDAALEAADARGLALVPLVAPTTPKQRVERIGALARGFLYLVSLTGTTGERSSIEDALPAMIERARAHTSVPVAVGFGVSTPEHARMVVEAGADGVIIGSRLVRAAADAEEPSEAVGSLVREFADALARPSASPAA